MLSHLTSLNQVSRPVSWSQTTTTGVSQTQNQTVLDWLKLNHALAQLALQWAVILTRIWTKTRTTQGKETKVSLHIWSDHVGRSRQYKSYDRQQRASNSDANRFIIYCKVQLLVCVMDHFKVKVKPDENGNLGSALQVWNHSSGLETYQEVGRQKIKLVSTFYRIRFKDFPSLSAQNYDTITAEAALLVF